MAQNGRLPASALSPIPGGRLRHDAARAFNAMNEESERRFDIGLRPAGPVSSYRTLASQWRFWRLWRAGRGNRAAYPGTSNHGWGLAVDLRTRQMRWIVDRIGAEYGWAKRWSDAADEWWHLRYRAGVWDPPSYPGLRQGSRGDAVRRLQHLLRDHGYLVSISGTFDAGLERTISAFQEAYGLDRSGAVGPQTWRALRGRVRDRDPLTDDERRLVTELWRLRDAGWTARRLARGRVVKRWLVRRLAELRRLARDDGGWERRRRRARYRIIDDAVERRRQEVSPLPLKTPDLTPAQLLAGALTVAGTGIGLYPRVSEPRGRAAAAGAALLGAALVGADASIRRARAQHIAPLVLDGEPDDVAALGPEDVPPEDELIDEYGPGEPEELAALEEAEPEGGDQPGEEAEPEAGDGSGEQDGEV